MQNAQWGLTNGTSLGQTQTNRDHKLDEIENKWAAQEAGKSGQARRGENRHNVDPSKMNTEWK